MEPILLFVNSIAAIDAAKLRNITFVLPEGVLFRYERNFEELPLVGLAECQCVSKVENKSRLFTTTLSAALCSDFESGDRPLAFLITTVSGTRFLVGCAEPPHPVVSTSVAMPGRESEQAGYSMTVELKDSLGLLRVLD